MAAKYWSNQLRLKNKQKKGAAAPLSKIFVIDYQTLIENTVYMGCKLSCAHKTCYSLFA